MNLIDRQKLERLIVVGNFDGFKRSSELLKLDNKHETQREQVLNEDMLLNAIEQKNYLLSSELSNKKQYLKNQLNQTRISQTETTEYLNKHKAEVKQKINLKIKELEKYVGGEIIEIKKMIGDLNSIRGKDILGDAINEVKRISDSLIQKNQNTKIKYRIKFNR
ncbi:hypothetical protein ACTFIR_011865 [Dictyostelium discoideum]